MKYLLILWLIQRPALINGELMAEPLGGIHSAEYKAKETCEVALKTVKEKSKFIDGACTEL